MQLQRQGKLEKHPAVHSSDYPSIGGVSVSFCPSHVDLIRLLESPAFEDSPLQLATYIDGTASDATLIIPLP